MVRGSRLRSLGVAVVLALVLVLAGRQITLHGWYAPNPGYRAQVDALLDGRLALTRSPDGLHHDLAWTPHGVQQVWGLGVPLWQLPFEALGRLIGLSPFPDRLALAAWLAAMCFVVIRAFRPRDVGEARPGDQRSDAGRTRPADSRVQQVGAILVTALLPGFVTVLRGRIGVYEEAAIYAYGAAMILLGGLLALLRRPTTARYLILLGFAGLTGLIRPTVWFYGLATALIASAVMVRQRGRQGLRVIALGTEVFVAGGGALYATNALRFGRGTEFGHRLNVHELPGNIVATRFSYPFERAGTIEAAQELLASLFDRPELRSKRGFYQTGLHRWQSPRARWREYYFTTYSWPYLPVIAAGLVLGTLAWRRRGDPTARALVAWAVLGGTPLLVFYLRSPSVASRYQLDLAPAIAACLVVAWRAAVARWPRCAITALVILWSVAVATSKYARPGGASDPIDREAAARTTDAITHAIAYDHALPAGYDAADPLLPIWTDAHDNAVRCSDALGARVACDATPVPGDVTLRITRLGPQWFVDRYVLPDAPAEPLCRAEAPDAGVTAAGEPRASAAEPGVRSEPAAVHDLAWVSAPVLYLNGFGWDLATGSVPPATLFYVEDAAYLTLDVAGPASTDWDHAVRAAIGLDHLRLVAVSETATGARLRFEGGRHPGLQIAFVAFGADAELDRARSAFRLRSIRWRDQ